MRWVRLFVVLVVMAGLADHELARQRVVERVSVAQVDPAVCAADGGTAYVTTRPVEPDVYVAHCGDGMALTTGAR